MTIRANGPTDRLTRAQNHRNAHRTLTEAQEKLAAAHVLLGQASFFAEHAGHDGFSHDLQACGTRVRLLMAEVVDALTDDLKQLEEGEAA